MRYNSLWILAPSLLLAVSAPPAHANLITDPGFESCTSANNPAPGWTVSSGNNFCNVDPHTGSWDNEFRGVTSTLSQTIVTVAGDEYSISFWRETDAGASGVFTVFFGSDEAFSETAPPAFGYMLQDVGSFATGTTTTISFSGASSSGTAWQLDDVVVTDIGPLRSLTPEPASLVLLASGLLASAWQFRRQRA